MSTAKLSWYFCIIQIYLQIVNRCGMMCLSSDGNDMHAKGDGNRKSTDTLQIFPKVTTGKRTWLSLTALSSTPFTNTFSVKATKAPATIEEYVKNREREYTSKTSINTETDKKTTPTDTPTMSSDTSTTPTDTPNMSSDTSITPSNTPNMYSDTSTTPTDTPNMSSDISITPSNTPNMYSDTSTTPTDTPTTPNDTPTTSSDTSTTPTNRVSTSRNTSITPSDWNDASSTGKLTGYAYSITTTNDNLPVDDQTTPTDMTKFTNELTTPIDLMTARISRCHDSIMYLENVTCSIGQLVCYKVPTGLDLVKFRTERIDPKTTSKYQRTLTSAQDDRLSVVITGSVGGAIMVGLFVGVVALDADNLIKMFKGAVLIIRHRPQLRHLFSRTNRVSESCE